jgi:hypothetical protein
VFSFFYSRHPFALQEQRFDEDGRPLMTDEEQRKILQVLAGMHKQYGWQHLLQSSTHNQFR